MSDFNESERSFNGDVAVDGAIDADSASVTNGVDAGSLSTDDASIADVDNLTERRSDETDAIIGGHNWYLVDDWGDSALTGRTNPVTGQYVSGADGKLRSFYRPEWTTENGSPSASGGSLVLPDGSETRQSVERDTNFSVGEWTFQFERQSAASEGLLLLYIARESGQNEVRLDIEQGGAFELVEKDSDTVTTIISTTWPDDEQPHEVSVTRDSLGNWELFFDGTSQGTAASSFFPALPAKTRFDNRFDAEINCDWVELRR